MTAAAVLFAAAPVVVRGEQTRFSRTLSATEFKEAGLQRLSSDQLAVLDALVRQDAQFVAESAPGKPPAAQFTERLATDEAHAAGINLLSGAQRARLNAFVSRYENAERSDPSPGSGRSGFDPDFGDPGPEVHGMVSLTYGVGAGGYHEMGGAMAVSIDDPAHGVSLMFGYGESRGRGPWPGRCWGAPAPDCFGPWGPLGP